MPTSVSSERSGKAGPASIAVLGLGNVLMGDDGFGPQVVRVLEATYAFDARVSVQDLGTPGLNLLPYVAGVDAIIIVDTVRAEGEPGTIRLYRKEDLLRRPPSPRTNPHDPGLKEAILSAEIAGSAPREVVLVGVVPERVDAGTGLSPRLEDAVDSAARKVVAEVKRLGAEVRPLQSLRDPDLWWLGGGAASPRR